MTKRRSTIYHRTRKAHSYSDKPRPVPYSDLYQDIHARMARDHSITADTERLIEKHKAKFLGGPTGGPSAAEPSPGWGDDDPHGMYEERRKHP